MIALSPTLMEKCCFKPFTITNNLDGFNELYQKIESVTEDATKVKVGLEATGHYSYNLLGYLIDKGFGRLCYQSVTYQSVQKKSKP